jgi:uroporphyrinogen-III decarboxylase
MPFTDQQERIIEKSQAILTRSDHVIIDAFTRFNTIYIGNISKDRVNVEIQLMYPAIAKLLDFDLEKYYQDPYYNFEKTMEYRVWHHENIPDDTPFIGIYEIEYGVYTFEYSLLGMKTKWVKDDYPVLGPPAVQSEKDIEEMEIPDFFRSGYMPHVIESYRSLKKDLRGRLEIGVRKFVHGPTQFCSDLRGIQNFYVDLYRNPQFVKRVFDFYLDYLRAWIHGWEQFHGRNYGMVHLGEDEIDTKSMIPPEIFREIILPYHKKLGEEYESVHWHSCGDVNKIMKDVCEIPHLEVVECGPQTDAFEASKIFEGRNVFLYKCPVPVTELLDPEPGAQERMIENVLKAGEKTPIKLLIETPELAAGMKMLEKFRKIYGA